MILLACAPSRAPLAYPPLPSTTAPSEIPGYNFTARKDSGGGDIKQVPATDILAVAQACSDDPVCLAFNTGGWLKKELKPEYVSDSTHCWVVRGH
jgi:hypothetical protein